MQKEKLLICTFSGGRTSAFMCVMLKEHPKYKAFDKVFIFANTGKERPETLDFINKCDKNFNLKIVWLEADIKKTKGLGTNYKIVNYKTASRNGEPFVEMCKKYPLPNNVASNCTRELKLAPINKFIKSLNYKKNYTAIGIRHDEKHRQSNTAIEQNIIYPLINDLPVDSEFVRNWWERQAFDLELKDYEGNCDLCFKKSLKKRLTIIKENPKLASWWLNLEEKYSSEITPRLDLRTNKSIAELIEIAKRPFTTAQDIHKLNKQQINLFEFETDCLCKAN